MYLELVVGHSADLALEQAVLVFDHFEISFTDVNEQGKDSDVITASLFITFIADVAITAFTETVMKLQRYNPSDGY